MLLFVSYISVSIEKNSKWFVYKFCFSGSHISYVLKWALSDKFLFDIQYKVPIVVLNSLNIWNILASFVFDLLWSTKASGNLCCLSHALSHVNQESFQCLIHSAGQLLVQIHNCVLCRMSLFFKLFPFGIAS